MAKVFMVNIATMAVTGYMKKVPVAGAKEGETIVCNESDLYNQFTSSQLVKMYNQYAERSLIKFKDKKAAACRTFDLLNSDVLKLPEMTSKDEAKVKQKVDKTFVEYPNGVLVAPHRKSNKLYKLLDHFVANPNKEFTSEELEKISGFTPQSIIVRVSNLNIHHNMKIVKNKETGGFIYELN